MVSVFSVTFPSVILSDLAIDLCCEFLAWVLLYCAGYTFSMARSLESSCTNIVFTRGLSFKMSSDF